MEKKILIRGWEIIALVVFFLYALPASLYRVQIWITIQDLVAYLCFAYFVIDLLAKHYRRYSFVLWMIIIMWALVFVSTYIHNPDLIISLGKQAIKSVAFLSFIERGIRKHGTDFLRIIWIVISAIAIINLLTIIIYPGGMYTSGSYSTNYFMGYHNAHIRWELPGLMCKYAYDKIVYKRVKFGSIVLSILMLTSALLVSSITSIVVFSLISLFMVYDYACGVFGKEQKIKIRPIWSLIVLIAGTIIVVGGTIASTQLEFVSNISNYFSKGSSFNGRSSIWISSLYYISQNLWFGNGYETSDMTSEKLATASGWGSSAHNLALEVLYVGGIILFICMIIIYLYLHRRTQKQDAHLKTVTIVGLWLMAISIMGIVEPQYEEYTRLAWIMAYYIPIIEIHHWEQQSDSKYPT